MSMKRQLDFDVLRIWACLMIVAMHSPLPASQTEGMFLSSLSYLTAPGIGLFFMVSGALLLPVKQRTGAFLKRRFMKIAIPTLVWTLFYLCCNAWLNNEPLTGHAFLSIPFSPQGNPVFWFIYTLLGLYLLAPIVSHWLTSASKREVGFYLCLWVVSLCYPLISFMADVNTSNTGILYYFSGYGGYFLLGYYLKSYPDSLSFKWLLPAMGFTIAIPVICKLQNIKVDFYSLFWYTSVFVAIQCIFWWRMIHWFAGRWESGSHPFLAEMSKLTFGIYLIHIFIMRYLLWKWDFILGIQPYWLQTVTIIILTFGGSLVVTYLISLFPFAKYLTGYQCSRSY